MKITSVEKFENVGFIISNPKSPAKTPKTRVLKYGGEVEHKGGRGNGKTHGTRRTRLSFPDVLHTRTK